MLSNASIWMWNNQSQFPERVSRCGNEDYAVTNPDESQRAKYMLYSNVTGYYPYGLPWSNLQATDRYLYSGKDLDRSNGLMLYDFHARLYDPQLGRFLQPDPCSTAYPSQTPWLYCLANPVMCTDPSGMYVTEKYGLVFDKVENDILPVITLLTRQLEENPEENFATIARIEQLQQSLLDIRQMRRDPEREYRLMDFTEANCNKTIALETLNENDDQVIVMYAHEDYEFKLHEIRHGGQIAREELIIPKGKTTPINYSIDHEVDAYRAGFAFHGHISHNILPPGWDGVSGKEAFQEFLPFKNYDINSITPEFVRQLGKYSGDPELYKGL